MDENVKKISFYIFLFLVFIFIIYIIFLRPNAAKIKLFFAGTTYHDNRIELSLIASGLAMIVYAILFVYNLEKTSNFKDLNMTNSFMILFFLVYAYFFDEASRIDFMEDAFLKVEFKIFDILAKIYEKNSPLPYSNKFKFYPICFCTKQNH